jgi:hypothetical protein
MLFIVRIKLLMQKEEGDKLYSIHGNWNASYSLYTRGNCVLQMSVFQNKTSFMICFEVDLHVLEGQRSASGWMQGD